MANNQGRINFQVGFNVNKSGLQTIKTELEKIQNLTVSELKLQGIDVSSAKLQKFQEQAAQLAGIFERSYNVKLGGTDFTKFNSELKKAGLSLSDLTAKSQQFGSVATSSFNQMNAALSRSAPLMKESHKFLDKMKDTFMNTVRWSIASTAINNISGSIQKAYNFAVDLDTSLNDIRIVTGKSAEEMERFARKANEAARNLGASTKAYTEASLIYYQQGLGDAEVKARSDVTVKAANVTGQSAQTVSEQLTAVWNGYKVSAAESELYIDKLAAVAAATAADLEELSTGMSKVASAANIMGVDIDSLNAQLATIVSVTREAPESIGTALKTVYARMSDIEAGLDTETTLGEYTSQMAEMGINVLDAQGNLRDMGDVVEEIGDKWENLTRNQQASLAQTIAGTRQYSRMMALFDNWDMYESTKIISTDSAGELQKQQEIYLDSLEAKTQQLKATTEQLYIALIDNDGVKELIEDFTTLIDLVGQFTNAVGGGKTLLLSLGGMAISKLGSDKIGEWAGATMGNHLKNESIRKNREAEKELYNDEIKAIQTVENSYLHQETSLKAKAQEQLKSLELTKQEGKISEEQYKAQKAALEEEISFRTKTSSLAAQAGKLSPAKDAKRPEVLEKAKEDASKRLAEFEFVSRLSEKEAQEYKERAFEIDNINAQIQALQEEAVKISAELAEREKMTENERTAAIEQAREKAIAAYKKEQKEKFKAEKEEALKSFDKKGGFNERQQNATAMFRRLGKRADGVGLSQDTTISWTEATQGVRRNAAEVSSQLRGIASSLTQTANNEQLFADSINNKSAEEIKEQIKIIQDLGLESAGLELSQEDQNFYIRHFNHLAIATEEEAKKIAKEILNKHIKDLDKLAADAQKEAEWIDSEDTREQAKNKAETEKKYNKFALTEDQEKEAKKRGDAAVQEENQKEKNHQAELDRIKKEKEAFEALKKQKEDEEWAQRQKQATKEVAEGTTKLTGSVLAFTGVLSSITSIPSIWENNDLTAGEKVFQTLSNIAFIIPTIISSFKDFKSGWGTLMTGLDTILDVSIKKQKESTAENLKNAASNMINAAAQNKANEEKKEGVVANEAENAAEQANTAGNLKNAGSNKFKDIFGKGGKFGEWFKGGGGKVVGNVAGYAAAIALVVAATAAAISITKAIDEKAQREFESAKQEAEMLATEAERAESSYEELSSSIDSLEDSQDNIKKLTKGTLEWKEALYEVNQQVLDLIAKYPELMQYMATDEDGVMSISQEGLQKVQEEQFEEMKQANAASIAAQNRAKRAEIEVQKDRFAEQAAHGGANQTAISGVTVGGAGAAGGIAGGILAATASSAAAGAAAGSVAPGIGTLIGAAVGVIVGAIGAAATYATMEAAEDQYKAQLDSPVLDKVVEAYQTSGDSMFKSTETLAAALGKDVSALSSLELALLNNKDETIALVESMANLEATNRALAIQMGAAFTDENATTGEQKMVGDFYQQEYDKLLTEIKDNQGWNSKDKEYAREALRIMGISEENLIGAKGKNRIQYLDENGNEQDVPIEKLLAIIAQDRASKKTEDYTKKMDKVFSSLDSLPDNIRNYVSELGQEGFSLATTSYTDLLQMQELKLTDEQLNALEEATGESVETLRNQFITAVNQAIENTEKAAENWEDDLRYAFALDFGDFGLDVFDKFTGLFKNNAQDMYEVYDAFKRVTWTDDDSVEEFRNALIKLFGKDSLTLIEDFISLSKRNQGVRFDIKKAQEGYSIVNKVLESLEKAGDTISASDWESLPKYLQDYFVVMADGTYALIEDAKTLKELFGNEYFTDLEDQINKVRTELNPVYKDTLPQLEEELRIADKNLQDITDNLKTSGNNQTIKNITEAFTALTDIGGTSGSAATGKRVSAFWADTGNREENLEAYLAFRRQLDEYGLSIDDFSLGEGGEKYSNLTSGQKRHLTNLYDTLDKEVLATGYDSSGFRIARTFLKNVGGYTAIKGNSTDIDFQRVRSALDVIEAAGLTEKGQMFEKEFQNYRNAVDEGKVTNEMLYWIDVGLKEAEKISTELEASKKAAEEAKQEAQRVVNEITAKMKSEDLDPEDREKLEEELKNLQTQYAASAGSKDKFLQAVEAGIITDGEIIKDYYKYYDNLAKTLADVNSWNIDVYEEINRELERAQRNYDALTDAQDKLTGQMLLNNLNKQNKALEKQIDLQRQKADKDKEESTNAKEELISYLNTLPLDENIKLAFDENGYLNASQLYTDLAKKHSKGELTKEDQDKVQELAEAYNATRDAALETEDAIKELIYSKLDINAEIFSKSIDIDANMDEVVKTWNDTWKGLGVVFNTDGAVVEMTFSDQADFAEADFKAAVEGIEEAQHGLSDLQSRGFISYAQLKSLEQAGLSAKEIKERIGDSLTPAEYEAQLLELSAKYQENLLALKEAINSKQEIYISMLDEANSKYERQLDLINTVTELTEEYAEFQKLLGIDIKDSETMESTYGYARKSLDATIANLSYAKAEFDKLNDPNNQDYQGLTDEQKQKIRDNYYTIAKDTITSVNDLAQQALDIYQTKVQEIIEDTAKKVFGTSAEFAKEETDWTKSQGNMYFDAVDTAYQIDKIAYNYDKILNSLQGSTAAQSTLNKLRDQELAKLRSREKLTKYDVDRAQKVLDLETARISLLEAQANKTQMRLTRGADGTYSYQYVADMNDIAEKEQKVKDLQNELINLDQQALQNSLDNAYNAYTAYFEAVQKAQEDGNISAEEQAHIDNLAASWQDALIKSDEAIDNYASALGKSRSELEQYILTNESGAEGISKSMITMLNTYKTQGIDKILGDAQAAISQAKTDYTLAVNELSQLDIDLNTEGVQTLDGLIKNIRDNILGKKGSSGISGEFNNLANEISKLYTQNILQGLGNLISKFENLAKEAKNFKDQVEDGIDSVHSDNEIDSADFLTSEMEKKFKEGSFTENEYKTLMGYINKYGYSGTESELSMRYDQTRAAAENRMAEGYDPLESNQLPQNDTSSPTTLPGVGEEKEENKFKEVGFLDPTKGISTVMYYHPNEHYVSEVDPNAPSEEDSWIIKNMWPITDRVIYQNQSNKEYYLRVANPSSGMVKYRKMWTGDNNFQLFDTGGYTGSWGDSSGRLAMLHEKELVLNKTDTKNILDVIDIVRQLDMSMLRYTAGLSQIKAGISSQHTVNQNVAPVQQQIQINAEFPNAENAEEIREAFNQLFNLAEQYAHEDPRF